TPGESGSSSTPTSRRAGLVQGRVNLLVASDEVATVVDVRRRRRHLLGDRISAGHLLAEGQAVARIGGHEPYPNTIPVGGPFVPPGSLRSSTSTRKTTLRLSRLLLVGLELATSAVLFTTKVCTAPQDRKSTRLNSSPEWIS